MMKLSRPSHLISFLSLFIFLSIQEGYAGLCSSKTQASDEYWLPPFIQKYVDKSELIPLDPQFYLSAFIHSLITPKELEDQFQALGFVPRMNEITVQWCQFRYDPENSPLSDLDQSEESSMLTLADDFAVQKLNTLPYDKALRLRQIREQLLDHAKTLDAALSELLPRIKIRKQAQNETESISSEDVQNKPWSDPVWRELMHLHQRLIRFIELLRSEELNFQG